MVSKQLTVVQVLPALDSGGVEKGTLEVGRYLVAHGHRSIVISAGGRMVPQLEREGSEHLAWDVGTKRPWTLRWVSRLRRLLVEQHVDILHPRSRLPAWIAYWAWRGRPAECQTRLVTSVHGPYTPGRYSSVMVRGERVIAISEMIREYILRHYPQVDPAIIRLIPRGVDPQHYPHGYQPAREWLDTWNRQYPQLAGKFVITLPARLTRWKGQEDFIAILAGLKGRGIPVHGLLVGEAHPRKRSFEDELRAQIAARGLQGDISFVGHRTDLKDIMAVSHVVVSLSTDPEAFGRISLEALSLGIPVAAYDHGGVGEQLREIYPAGRIVPGDRQAAEALLASWYPQAPAVPTHQPFTLERMLASTLATYRELVPA